MNAIMRIEVQVLTKQGMAQLRDLQAALGGVAGAAKIANAAGVGFAGTNNALATFGHNLDASGQALTKWGKNMQWTGRQLTTAFTLPILLAAAAALTFGIKNEEAFTQVEKAYAGGGASAQQMHNDLDLLKKDFEDLSSIYGVQQSEVDAIGAQWASAGDRGVDLARAVKLTLDTIILGNLGYQDAAKFLIALRIQFGLTASQAQDAVATIAAADQAAGATFKDMTDALSRTGGAAAQFGLTVQQTVAAIAALTPSMGSAYRAGIALQTILVRLNAPSKAGVAAYKELGINVTDMAWKHLSAVDKLKKLADQTRNLTDAQKTQALSDITSKLQVTRTIELLDQINNKQSQYNKVLNATADANKNAKNAQAQINTVLSSDPQALKIVWTQLQNQLAQIGILLIPVLLNLAHTIVGVLNAFNGLSPATKQWILIALGVLAIIGPITRYIGAFVTLAGVIARGVGSLLAWVFGYEEVDASALATQAVIEETSAAQVAATEAAAEATIAAMQAMYATLAAQAAEGAALQEELFVGGIMETLTAVPQLALEAGSATGAAFGEGLFITGMDGVTVFVSEYELALAAMVETSATFGTGAGAAFSAGVETGTEAGFAALPLLIGAAVVVGLVVLYRFRDQIGQIFMDIVHTIGSAFAALPGVMLAAMQAVVNVIASAAKAIYQFLSYLNPFAKHSPSLVDQVRDGTKEIGDHYDKLHKRIRNMSGQKKSATSHTNPLSVLNPYTKHSPSLIESVEMGIDAISRKYQSLRGLAAVFTASNSALMVFKKDLAETAIGIDRITLEEKKAQVMKFAPQAGPQVEVMINQILTLESELPKLQAEFDAQEAVTARWSVALGIVNNQLQIEQDRLTVLTDKANLYKTALDKGQQDLQTITTTPIQGMKAMGDAIFANDQAQKQLNLDMLKIEDSVGVTGNVVDKLAAINGQLEMLKGKRESLRQAGAGSDVLGGITGQIGALQGQSDSLVQAAAKIKALQDALDKLKHTGDELNLEQSLKFDPLTRELNEVANGIRELPFTELLNKAKAVRAENDKLQVSYQHANIAVIEQQAVVAKLTLARDQLQLGYDIENQKLTALGTAYDDVTAQIQAMTQAIDDLIAKQSAAKSGGAGALFAGSAGGVKTPNIGGLNQDTGSLADELKNLEKKMKGVKLELPDWKHAISTWFSNLIISFVTWEMRLLHAAERWADRNPFGPTMIHIGHDIVAGLWLGLQNGLGLLDHWGQNAVHLFAGIGADMVDGFWHAFGHAWSPVSNWFQNMAKTIVNYVGSLAQSLAHDGAALVGGFFHAIGSAWIAVSGFFRGVGNKIIGYVGSLAGVLIHAGSALISGLWRGISTAWGTVGGFLSGLAGRIVSTVPSLLGSLYNAGHDLISGLWAGMKAAWNWLADKTTFKLPSFHIKGTNVDIGGGTVHLLPHLAQGAIVGAVPGGTAAILGEAGRREAILPLPPGLSLGRMINLMSSLERSQTNHLAQTSGTVNLGKGRVNVFHGDLVFPNVKSGDDAEAFVRNLESMDT